jgi:hypothetical protein
MVDTLAVAGVEVVVVVRQASVVMVATEPLA